MIGHCATRIVKHGDLNNIRHRVAFIEKTPRVCINNSLTEFDYGVHYATIECNQNGMGGATSPEEFIGKRSIWIEGYKGSSDYGMDRESRSWCDEMLKAMGWEVEEE